MLQSAALYELGVGRWAEVREHLEEAAAIVRRLGDPRRLAEITGLGVWERYFQGDLPAVRAAAGRAGPARPPERRRPGPGLGGGRPRRRRAAHRRPGGGRGGPAAGGPAPAPAALLALQLGDRAGAVEPLRRALEQAARPLVKCYWFDLYAMSAEVALALWLDRRARGEGDAGPWRAMAVEAVGHLGRYARVFPIGRPRALLYRGLLAWTPGGRRPGPGGTGGPPWPPPSGWACATSRPWPSTCWAGTGSRGSARPTASGPGPCSSGWGSRT